jgi:hypothetical protein
VLGSQPGVYHTPGWVLCLLPHWYEHRIGHNVCVMPQSGEEPRPKPSTSAFFSNWTTYDAPFATKLRMAASNTFLKLRKHQSCCGNHGQPGC